MSSPIVNKPETKKRGNPAWKKGGPSPNPAGAPKRGQSWRELIAEMGKYDGPEAAKRAGFLARQFNKLTPGVSLKELVVLRVYAALIDDPQPGLLNAFIERVEGKVADELKMRGEKDAPLVFQVVYGARRIAAQPAREASGDDRQPEAPQNALSGPARREDNGAGDAGGA